MAEAGDIIFRSLIVIIFILVGLIALIIGLGVAGNASNTVTASGAVGLIGESGILPCTFPPDPKQTVTILWEKPGLSGNILLYDNGKVDLTNQNAIFKGRTQVFPTQVATGNASLQLSQLTLADNGTYKCTVTTSSGKSAATMKLKVGLYTSVDVTISANHSLLCSSDQWYPQPNVTWFNAATNKTLDAQYTPGLGLGISWFVNSVLEATPDTEYLCVVENELARGSVYVVLKASGQLLKNSNLLVLNAVPCLHHLSPIQGLLLPLLAYTLTLL